ncbi:hypothetical protein IVA79_18085 [Bradyrhizobium sp. 138]|uniref:hypothetical protein n=1 Tax=Bradyrhizobium sp. 138 TaxID=2782615 RepID=UPI001FF9888A|nr:hypothetical protein [Bradyrhizobium sp. 138]MCK1735796.1 hypothetical protein [Bradyrhizobium sp. 138]
MTAEADTAIGRKQYRFGLTSISRHIGSSGLISLDRLLALKDQVEPAGIREARLAAENATPDPEVGF